MATTIRTRRVARWSALTLTAALGAAWVVNLFVALEWRSRHTLSGLAVHDAAVFVYLTDAPADVGEPGWAISPYRSSPALLPWCTYLVAHDEIYTVITVPLWLPLAAAALVTRSVWRRRAEPAGHQDEPDNPPPEITTHAQPRS